MVVSENTTLNKLTLISFLRVGQNSAAFKSLKFLFVCQKESGIFYQAQQDKEVKILLSPTLPPPYFLSPFFKDFVTHPRKINELDTAVTVTPVLRP